MATPGISFAEADFGSLEGFRLSWRWTGPNFAILAQSDLAAIRPLRPDAARRVHAVANALIDSPSRRLSPELFPLCIECITSGDASGVCEWLERATGSFDPSLDIVVSWDASTAVATKLLVFVKHWEDFCYPSSDDVTAFPFDLDWAIQYWREEVLYFGNRTPQAK